MRSRAITTLVGLVILWTAATVTGLHAGTSNADAWTTGACQTANGVTVVIDFHELGGGIHIRCAPGPVASGFEALSKAGIDYQTTIRQPGFLCKIAGKPSNDPCIDTSPATAYWSYWLAPRGGTWCYSNWGAGNRTPPAGSVEGWSFSLNKTASTSPPPGTPPPPAIPGVPTGTLSGNDCDPRASAPQATTTTAVPPTTGSPATTPSPNPTLPPNNPSTNGSGSAASPSGSGTTGSGTGSSASSNVGDTGATAVDPSNTDTSSATASDGDTTGETTVPDATTEVESSQATKTGKGNKEHASAPRGASDEVNLGGSHSKTSPIGVVLALLIAVGIGTIAVVRRRGA